MKNNVFQSICASFPQLKRKITSSITRIQEAWLKEVWHWTQDRLRFVVRHNAARFEQLQHLKYFCYNICKINSSLQEYLNENRFLHFYSALKIWRVFSDCLNMTSVMFNINKHSLRYRNIRRWGKKAHLRECMNAEMGLIKLLGKVLNVELEWKKWTSHMVYYEGVKCKRGAEWNTWRSWWIQKAFIMWRFQRYIRSLQLEWGITYGNRTEAFSLKASHYW